MKRSYQETGDTKEVSVFAEYQFEKGEVPSEDLIVRIVADLKRAIDAHNTTIVIREYESFNEHAIAIRRTAKTQQKVDFSRIIRENNLTVMQFSELMGLGKNGFRQVFRWKNGTRPRARSCKIILQLHTEGKLKISYDDLLILRQHEAV